MHYDYLYPCLISSMLRAPWGQGQPLYMLQHGLGFGIRKALPPFVNEIRGVELELTDMWPNFGPVGIKFNHEKNLRKTYLFQKEASYRIYWGFLFPCQEAKCYSKRRGPQGQLSLHARSNSIMQRPGQACALEADRSVWKLESYVNRQVATGHLHHSSYKTGRVAASGGISQQQMCKVPCTVIAAFLSFNKCSFPFSSLFFFFFSHAQNQFLFHTQVLIKENML